MKLKPHQKESTVKAVEILKIRHLVYIFGPPRIGKSLIALQTAMESGYSKALVLTKKAAIEGWTQYVSDYAYEGFNFIVTNYEQIGRFNPAQFDIVIIDEAHNFSAYPRPSKRIKDARLFCKNKPIIFLSGTPVVEGYYKLYAQLSLSSFSPFAGTDPYKFFRTYGIPHKMRLQGRDVEMYDTFHDDKIELQVAPYLVKVTFEDAGMQYQNNDKVINLCDEDLLKLCRNIKKCRIIEDKPLENVPAVNQALHRLCGGIYEGFKSSDVKIKWLREFISRNKGAKIAVMAYFIEEQEMLASIKGIDVFSSTKYCEGVDLSEYDHFILYSFGYSGAKFVQLRDRIVNINKDRKTEVIIPLIENALDSKIYAAVREKRNFNTSKLYE